jgi:glycosyltransferase involved in cell wall biosynthesis
VALTSDNECTPVSLIEAQAAAVSAVGTDVGGVRSAVTNEETGLLAPPGDAPALVTAVAQILPDPGLASALARAGRDHALRSFGVGRLAHDLDRLYCRLLADRGVRSDLKSG